MEHVITQSTKKFYKQKLEELPIIKQSYTGLKTTLADKVYHMFYLVYVVLYQKIEFYVLLFVLY